MFFVAAVICALLGVVPYLVSKRLKAAAIQGITSTLILWLFFYGVMPSTVWPLFGGYGAVVLLLWCIAAAVDGCLKDKFTGAAAFPIVLAVLFIGSTFPGCGMLRAKDYASMIQPMESRVWTQDIQPKDPKHMRMSTEENALYMAQKVLGEAGAIGSQFEISLHDMTLQLVRNELWYVVPLDFSGFSVWWTVGKAPGYIMIHAEDPNHQPKLIILAEGKQFLYTPEAFFGKNLERHLRNNGFLDKGLTDYTLEIDEDYNPWWVVTVYEPTIVWNGEKITGVVKVDPVSGDCTFYPADKIPHWMDRAVPQYFPKTYLKWWGKYSGGWLNSWWGTHNLTKPEKPSLIYGSDNEPYWVTGVTSKSSKDDSLVGLVYTHSRTGKSIFYATKGGGTDAAVLDAVNKNQEVGYRRLHGRDPQLYNVYGTMASVVPLLNESHAFQGVAIVNIKNVQMVAVGRDQYEALQSYQSLLSQSGQQIALEKERHLEKIVGIVDRTSHETSRNITTYYIHLQGVPHVFIGGKELSAAKLPVTQTGDKVQIEFYASGEDLMPMRSFDNLSLKLKQTPAQTEIKKKAEERKEGQEARDESNTILENIKKMSPEQLKELEKKLKNK